tara:strand:- start:647 stop:781 length:135 start_codon:yes stop_codon:yes gene_type:complete
MIDILIKGAADCIGFHACENLLKKGYRVIGIDNMNYHNEVKSEI